MPNPGELKAACEAIEAPARRIKERNESIERFLEENKLLEVPREGRLTFEELQVKYGQTWGIGTDQESPQVKKERAFTRYTDDELRAIYGSSEGKG